MTSSNLMLEIVAIFKQMEKKEHKKEQSKYSERYTGRSNGTTRIRINLWLREYHLMSIPNTALL